MSVTEFFQSVVGAIGLIIVVLLVLAVEGFVEAWPAILVAVLILWMVGLL